MEADTLIIQATPYKNHIVQTYPTNKLTSFSPFSRSLISSQTHHRPWSHPSCRQSWSYDWDPFHHRESFIQPCSTGHELRYLLQTIKPIVRHISYVRSCNETILPFVEDYLNCYRKREISSSGENCCRCSINCVYYRMRMQVAFKNLKSHFRRLLTSTHKLNKKSNFQLTKEKNNKMSNPTKIV